ncbi:hypothetical protein [Sphingomonas sp. SRS2]|uniref:hypothetical protein n=1 Tax=Sphingomonas sp. SRS2 TaxID=133190 RepID=UPI00061841E6|nr:hypothetical protein [Sphingomonas sp. SRS2]KKC27688.1 hypothetical protein WP12_01805 [Sphingomonas sp. SRS2]
MTRNLLAIMLAGTLLAPAVAQASSPRSTTADAIRTSHKVAQCLYDKRKSDVMAALGTSADAEAQRYHNNLSRAAACRRITLSNARIEGVAVETPRDIMRGMLAEAALANIWKLDALQPQPAQPSYQRDWFGATSRDRAVDEMAVCAAEQNPGGIRTLIATSPESGDELSAVQALSPTLSPCLPQGATLKANRQSLRAALAEALYHRATTSALASK